MKKVMIPILIALSMLALLVFSRPFFINDDSSSSTFKGFDQRHFIVPKYDSQSSMNNPFHYPSNTSDIRYSGELNFSLMWSFIEYEIYAGYGPTAMFTINNNMDRYLFIDYIEIETSYNVNTEKKSGIILEPYETQVPLGLLHIDGPVSMGNYSYNVKIGIWICDNGQYKEAPEQILANNVFEAINLKVAPSTLETDIVDACLVLHSSQDINAITDPLFHVVNDRYDPASPNVRNKAVEIASLHPGAYNIWQVIELYEHVRRNISYVSDPRTVHNYWATPNETLSVGGGDCEDQAMLLGSMVTAIGGSCRIYITGEHAFCGVYIGSDEQSVENLTNALHQYYGTPLHPFLIEDEFGYWAVADPTGSLYFSGCSSDGFPLLELDEDENIPYVWGLGDDNVLWSIDLGSG